MSDELDPLLTQKIRLIVVSVLSQVVSADFNHLKERTGATQGNLSHQLKKLQDANYITITKHFENNYPKTVCKLTQLGRSSFERYIIQMKKYLNIDT